MKDFALELIAYAAHDLEAAQYRILGNLQQAHRAFSRNRVYPHLFDLIRVYGTLRTIAQQTEGIREAVPRRIKGLDLENREVVYEQRDLSDAQIGQVEEIIAWALPRMQKAIEEGRAIFEFVDEHLHLEEVGIVPSYLQEGYLLIPDHEEKQLYVMQYSLSILTGADGRYRSLKTTHVRTISQEVAPSSPHNVKMALVQERRELPNPATYYFETDLDFPFEPTIMPVAKRKLMQHLYAEAA